MENSGIMYTIIYRHMAAVFGHFGHPKKNEYYMRKQKYRGSSTQEMLTL